MDRDGEGEDYDVEGGGYAVGEETGDYTIDEEYVDDEKKDVFAGAHVLVLLLWRCLRSCCPTCMQPHLYNMLHAYLLLLQVLLAYYVFFRPCGLHV